MSFLDPVSGVLLLLASRAGSCRGPVAGSGRELLLAEAPAGILLATIILLTGGCASVPIRTALRLRSLTPEALLSAAPERIRAAVQIDRGVRLDAGTSSLVISLLPATGGLPAETHPVPLRTLVSGADVHPGLPPADPGRYWTVLGVSPRGKGALEEIQRRLADPRGEYSGMRIRVEAVFGELPEELRDAFSIEVWIHLLPEQGFLKLYEARSGSLQGQAGQPWTHQLRTSPQPGRRLTL